MVVLLPEEAAARFGDLARIRQGLTTWISVETPEGWYHPFWHNQFQLAGYRLEQDNQAPYCLVCSTMGRMTRVPDGFKCEGVGDHFHRPGCGNVIGMDMRRKVDAS